MMGPTLMGPQDSEGKGPATTTESRGSPPMRACRWASQEEATSLEKKGETKEGFLVGG